MASRYKAFPSIRTIWSWCGWIPSVIFNTVGWWLFLSQSDMSEGLRIIVGATGIILITLAVRLLLIWVVWIIWRLTPAQRFKTLEPDLINVRNSLGGFKVEKNVQNDSRCIRLTHKLDKLKIGYPSLENSFDLWSQYLSRLIGEAGAAAIKEGRKVWA